VFRAAVGAPLAAYIRRRRLCHAARDLLASGESILDIALRYGFASHEAFIRAFRKELGCAPSTFRKAGSALDSGVIVPGIFGPMPPRKETIVETVKGIEKGPGFAVIHGVPEVSYFNDRHEVTPFPSSLRSCLAYMGVDVPYAQLLAASGAAFRLMWNTAMWDGGNVDILLFRKDPFEPLRRACRAAGIKMDLLCRRRDDHGFFARAGGAADVREGIREDFLSLITREIDTGRPLVGFGIIGPPEACVITGYRDGGESLIGWNFFQAMPEFAGDIGKTDEGCFVRRGWYEHRETIAILALAEKTTCPGPRELARDTLSLAADVIAPYRLGDHAGGQRAFEAWAAALSKEDEFPQGAPLHQLMERQMCMTDALTMVGEGRYYAAEWCARISGELPGAGSELDAAAKDFKAEHDLVWSMWALLGGMGMGEAQAKNLARADIRKKLVATILKAKERDKAAAMHLAAAREKI
jgi:hypothetical protein